MYHKAMPSSFEVASIHNIQHVTLHMHLHYFVYAVSLADCTEPMQHPYPCVDQCLHTVENLLQCVKIADW